jgi:Zn-dependent protease with chaperone function
MKKRQLLLVAAATVAAGMLAGGCSTVPVFGEPKFSGPRPGETWRVSTEKLVLRERPDGLSKPVGTLAYGDAVAIRQDVLAEPPFAGDRRKFPKYLIPGWVQVDAAPKSGYAPISSLASEWLLDNQDPNESISVEGMSAARRGFSESETDAELASMRGAAGKGNAAASADANAVGRALRGRKAIPDEVVWKFVASGGLEGRPVRPEVLEVEERGALSGAFQKSRQWTAKGLDFMSGAMESAMGKKQDGGQAPDKNAERGGKLLAASGKAVSGLVYSEIGPLQEFQMGKAVAARIFPMYKAVDPGDRKALYVACVGEALARASNDPMPYHGYVFTLLESDEVNAFAVPGGFVFVTTGMLDFLRDEDELAAILGHEMGHMELRHGVKAVGKEKVLRIFTLLKEIGTEGGEDGEGLSGQARELIDSVFGKMFAVIRNGYGVEIESQADWRSLQLCARLGYDTMALYQVLERFKAEKGSYGGASYPEERGADILAYRRQLGYAGDAEPAPGREARSKRYAKFTGRRTWWRPW